MPECYRSLLSQFIECRQTDLHQGCAECLSGVRLRERYAGSNGSFCFVECLSMCAWKTYPTPEVPSPVLALAGWQNHLWAGGAGGVASFFNSEWQLLTGLPLASCSSLVFNSGLLLAGGADGLARSTDGGQTWERAVINEVFQPVMALAVSPDIYRDFTALAGTLGGGILLSTDAGKSWKYSNIGMQNSQVLSLAWKDSSIVLAGTEAGIFRSTNGGRAWRAAPGAEDLPVAGLLILPDGSAMAASDGGRLLRSNDEGAHWAAIEAQGLPADGEVQSLRRTPWGTLLLSLSDMGVLQSNDEGEHWQPFLEEDVLELFSHEGRMYAGLESGAAEVREDGLQPLPDPPLHDLRSLMIYRQTPVVSGLHSRSWIYARKEGWRPLLDESEAVSALAEAPDGALLLSCSRGLLRSNDFGKNWETVLENEAGIVAHISFRPNGFGWAASSDGTRLIRTRDHGKHWEEQAAPFGGLPLAALQATMRELIAATYDPKRMIAQIWFSRDDGQNWLHGAEARTSWPVVTVIGIPPLLSLGGMLVVLQPNGTWTQHQTPGGGGIRRVVNSGKLMLVLTTAGLYRTTDRGATWELEQDCPPHYEIIDMALTEDGLYLLLTGGRLSMLPKEN